MNTAAPKNGTISVSTGVETPDISNLEVLIKMGDNAAKAEQNARENMIARLRNSATSAFSFRGRRTVHNNNTYFVNTMPVNDRIILPGRRNKPYSAYIKPAGNNALKEYNEEGRELASVVPDPATKLAPNRTRKALKLRASLFVPLELEGLGDWLKAQEAYIEALSTKDLDILRSYTSHGDRLVNGHCRGILTDVRELVRSMAVDESVPLAHSLYDQYDTYLAKGLTLPEKAEFLDESGDMRMETFRSTLSDNLDFFSNAANITSLLEQYKNDLVRIIERSPRPKKPIVVYRGIQSEAHLTNLRFQNIDFLSTTLDPYSVIPFTKAYENSSGRIRTKYYCCVYEMTIDPGVPCMYMQFISRYANEFEVLVPPGMAIEFDSKINIKVKPPTRKPNVSELLNPSFAEHVLVVNAAIRRPGAKKSRLDSLDLLVEAANGTAAAAAAASGAGADSEGNLGPVRFKLPEYRRNHSRKKFKKWTRTNKRAAVAEAND